MSTMSHSRAVRDSPSFGRPVAVVAFGHQLLFSVPSWGRAALLLCCAVLMIHLQPIMTGPAVFLSSKMAKYISSALSPASGSASSWPGQGLGWRCRGTAQERI